MANAAKRPLAPVGHLEAMCAGYHLSFLADFSFFSPLPPSAALSGQREERRGESLCNAFSNMCCVQIFASVAVARKRGEEEEEGASVNELAYTQKEREG